MHIQVRYPRTGAVARRCILFVPSGATKLPNLGLQNFIDEDRRCLTPSLRALIPKSEKGCTRMGYHHQIKLLNDLPEVQHPHPVCRGV